MEKGRAITVMDLEEKAATKASAPPTSAWSTKYMHRQLQTHPAGRGSITTDPYRIVQKAVRGGDFHRFARKGSYRFILIFCVIQALKTKSKLFREL